MSNVTSVQSHQAYGVDTTSADTSSGTTTSAAPPSLLADPLNVGMLGGDAMTAIAILLSQEDNEDRRASHAREGRAIVAEEHENAAQIQSLHDKADDIRSQGWAEGISQIGQGACELGAGVTTEKAGKLDVNDVCRASARAFGGAGSIIGKQYQAEAVLDDASAQAHASAAKISGQIAQEAHDDASDARAALEKVFSFLEGVRQAQNAAYSAAASLRP